MNKVSWTLICALLLCAPASAHGNMEHILGTVVEITDHLLSVKTGDGAVKRVDFDSQTKFVKGDAAATSRDVQVGSRVVVHVHAQKHENSRYAAEVRIGTSATRSQH